MRRNQKGFTLMELMVVIVIVAILAAVAVPLYINYVNDAKRTEAKGAIGAVITAQQTYYQQYGQYTAVIATPGVQGLNVDLADLTGRWTPTITGITPTSFTVRLDGVGATAGLWVQCVYNKGGTPVWTEG